MNKSLSRTILTGNQHLLIPGKKGRTQTADDMLVLLSWHGPSLQPIKVLLKMTRPTGHHSWEGQAKT